MTSLEGYILHRFVDRSERAKIFENIAMTYFRHMGEISRKKYFFAICCEFSFLE